MGFDDLKPQPPRTLANSRHPEEAIEYSELALARSRAAAETCRSVLDIPFGDDHEQKLDLFLPDDETARDVPVLLFFHGGAWAHGYKEWNGFMAPALVDLPAIFISAGYRLAPEHKFPAALDDGFAALDWVHRHIAEYGGGPGRIVVGGWSVGGTIAALLTLRRDLYGEYGLPDDVVKACLANCGGFRYQADVPAPGNSGITYGELIYARPEDDALGTPLNYVAGNRTPFYLSHGDDDFQHVMRSTAEMAAALEAAGGPVIYDVFPNMRHYAVNLAQGDPDFRWVQVARDWLRAPPGA